MTAREAVGRPEAGPGVGPGLDLRDLERGPGVKEAAPGLEVGRKVVQEATSPARSQQARLGLKGSRGREASRDQSLEASLVIGLRREASLALNQEASPDQDQHLKKNRAPGQDLAL